MRYDFIGTHIVTGFRFLLQSLEDLDNSLRKLNSRLFVVRGQPANVLPDLFKVCVYFLTSWFMLIS